MIEVQNEMLNIAMGIYIYLITTFLQSNF